MATQDDQSEHLTALPLARPTRRQLLVRAGIGLVITVGLFALIARFFDLADVVRLVQQARWTYLAAGLGLYVLLYLFRTWRFMLIAPRTPFGVMFCISALHNFFLRILPMRTGELSYVFLVQRAGTAGLGESLIGLLLLRLLDTTAVITLFASTLALNRALYRGDSGRGVALALGAALVGVLSVLAFARLLRWGTRVAWAIARVLRLGEHPLVSRLLGRLESAITNQRQLSPLALAGASSLTVLAWLTNYAIVWVVMHAITLDVSYAQAVLGSTAATVTAMLPITGIGSFGALEAGWTLGFVLVGLDATAAAASSIAFSLITFAYAGAFVLPCWWLLVRLARRRNATPAGAPRPLDRG